MQIIFITLYVRYYAPAHTFFLNSFFIGFYCFADRTSSLIFCSTPFFTQMPSPRECGFRRESGSDASREETRLFNASDKAISNCQHIVQIKSVGLHWQTCSKLPWMSPNLHFLIGRVRTTHFTATSCVPSQW